MQHEKVQKIDLVYLLGYIFIPLLICTISIETGLLCFSHGGTGAVITFMVFPILAAIWWIFAGSFIFRKHTRAFEKEFSAAGYKRNNTFYGRGKTVILDVDQGMLGICFYWNPWKSYILPAARVTKAWTDDGKRGSGFMEGSQQVSFVFIIDDVTVRVNTFTSNQRFRMDDKRILTGISKADMMVKCIEDAKKNSRSGTKATAPKNESASTKDNTKSSTSETSKSKKTAEKSTK